jgi:hypothetical protein
MPETSTPSSALQMLSHCVVSLARIITVMFGAGRPDQDAASR